MRPRAIMVDLETMGTEPGSVIVAIGACGFGNLKEHAGTFYQRISIESCQQVGLHLNAATLRWWLQQSDEARSELVAASNSLPEVLLKFAAFIGADEDEVEIWGNGASFDNALLSAAYRACNLPQPWKFWNERCYRTMKALYPEIPQSREGVHHNALDDAITQARHLAQILMHIGKGGEPVREGGAS